MIFAANRPAVIDVAITNGATRAQVLDVAAALEARSEHPLAAAIVAVAGVWKSWISPLWDLRSKNKVFELLGS